MAAPTFTVAETITDGGSGASAQVDATIPGGGASSGDLLLACVFYDENNSTIPSTNTPSGWTKLIPDNDGECGSGDIDIRLILYGRDCDGGEGSTVTVDSVLDPSESFVVYVFKVAAAEWSGTLSDLVIGARTDPSSSSGSSAVAASLTTLEDDSLVIALAGGDGADTEPTAVSGTGWGTTLEDSGAAKSGSTGASGSYVTKEVGTAGSSSDCTFTMGASDGYVAMQVAIPPSADTAVTAVLLGSWGAWSATGLADVDVSATALGSWGSMGSTALAGVDVSATGLGSWGALGATAVARPETQATAAGAWGGLSGTALASGATTAELLGAWGGWSATASADLSVSADALGAWGALSGTATAQKSLSATAEGAWGALDATALATNGAVVFADATGAWGALGATASATRTLTSAAEGSWGALGATCTAVRSLTASAVGNWGALDGTYVETFDTVSAVAQGTWGVLGATCTAQKTVTPTLVGGYWGPWTAEAQGPGPRPAPNTWLGKRATNLNPFPHLGNARTFDDLTLLGRRTRR